MKRNSNLGSSGTSRELSGSVGVRIMFSKSPARPSIWLVAHNEDAASRYDILVPHEVLDALRRCRPAFTLGHQHDAAEALALILGTTGLDTALFRCGEVLT